MTKFFIALTFLFKIFYSDDVFEHMVMDWNSSIAFQHLIGINIAMLKLLTGHI